VLVAVAAPQRIEAQRAPLWRTIDVARQIHDTLPQRIRVQYAVGRVDVRPAAASVLYDMHLRYDEGRGLPLHQYDAEQRATVLGLDARDERGGRGGDRKETGELRVGLPAAVPLDLDLDFGGTEATIELGGMMLRSVRMESGASEATVSFATPNRAHMREMDIDVGAASLTALHLANANADLIRVRGGVGGMDLDFGGSWTRDLTVNARLAIGQLTLRVPSNVGVRLEVQRVAAGFNHPGMTQRGDAWYSDNWETAQYKLRVRAENYFGEIDVRPVGP
jgi:Predicted membrane protein (DUF2154).